MIRGLTPFGVSLDLLFSMKLVMQRVRRAQVTVDGDIVGSIGVGAVVLVGVARGDTEEDAAWLAKKAGDLRIFDDADGKMNLGMRDVNGEFLVVSQFTLYGNCRKGTRPSYIDAADPDTGRALYEMFVTQLRDAGFRVDTGRFQQNMLVSLDNDGPVTLVLESRGRGAA